jgi:recombination endonuclease VII
MINECECGNPECQIEFGLCHCGCGGATSIAPRNHRDRGWIKGKPIRYLKGHAQGQRRDLHTLSGVDLRTRRAMCSFCGEVSIKKDPSRSSGLRCTGKINTEHRITELDLRLRRGFCLGCLEEVDVVRRNDNKWGCATEVRAQQLRSRTLRREARNKTVADWHRGSPNYNRDWALRKKYGMTLAEYQVKADAQGNVCFVCGATANSGATKHPYLVVDHCHKTGITRDLLCNRCNRVLGMVEEDVEVLEALIKYLRKWKRDLDRLDD